MAILDIKPMERAGSKVVIGIAGPTGSGKTFTALKIARGMVSHPSKIGGLDAENGRMKLYSNILDGKIQHADLYAPFSPSRYAQAIKEFQDAGVEVLVIDSGSHEWEGEGSCSDIAEQPLLNGKKMADWKRAKLEHKKFMTALLQSNMHIIICLRAREKTDFSNPKEPKPMGIHPVCERDFMFEMTVSMMMFDNGKVQEFTKLPEELRPIFFESGRDSYHNGYLGEAHGAGLLKWVNSGVKIDSEFEHWRSKLQMAASGGKAGLTKEAANVPDNMKEKIRAVWSSLSASADEYDRIAEFINDDEPAPMTTLSPEQGFNPAKINKPEPATAELHRPAPETRTPLSNEDF